MGQYTVYPNEIDSTNQLPIATDNVTPVNAEFVNRLREAIIAIESELGAQPSGTYATVRSRLDALDILLQSITGGSPGESGGGVVVNNVTELRSLTGNSVTVPSCILKQYSGTTGIGGGVFVWDDSLKTDDDGTRFNVGGYGTSSAGWQRVCGDVLEASWFGVIGDGVVDDTTAIQRALDISTEKTLYLNANAVSIVTSTLNVLSGTKIIGNNSEFDFSTAGNITGLSLATRCSIYGLTLTGPGGGVYNDNGRAIYCSGVNNDPAGPTYVTGPTISECTITGWSGYGIRLAYCERANITRNDISNCGYAGAAGTSCRYCVCDDNDLHDIGGTGTDDCYGAYWSRSNGASETSYPRSFRCSLSHNRVRNITIATNSQGLDTHGGEEIEFVKNIITDVDLGIAVVSSKLGVSYQLASQRCTIEGNIITGNNANTGIVVTGASDDSGVTYNERAGGHIINGNTLTNCSAPNNVNDGAIRAYGTDDLVICGNTIVRANNNAINLEIENHGFNISGNTIIDPHDGVQDGVCVRLHGNGNKGFVGGNTFRLENSGLDTKVAEHAIFVTTGRLDCDIVIGRNTSIGASSTRLKITTNNVDGLYVTQGLSDEVYLQGDNPVTLISGASPRIQLFSLSAFTTNRAVTLSTVSATRGDTFEIIRTVGNTGGPWLLDVGGLKSLAVGEQCKVVYTGSAWALASFGGADGYVSGMSVNNVTQLRALLSGSASTVVLKQNNASYPNIGGGIFFWDSVSRTDDSGTRFNVGGHGTSSAGWQRSFDTDQLDVTWFGAVGDGVVDDTTAISRALTAAVGRTLYFPSGSYSVQSSSLPFTIGSDTTIMGAGAEIARIVVAGTSPNNIFDCNNVHTINIKNLSFIGNSQCTSDANGRVISVSNSTTSTLSNFIIEQCYFENFKGDYWIRFEQTNATGNLEYIRVLNNRFISQTGNARGPTSLGIASSNITMVGYSGGTGFVRDVQITGNIAECSYIKNFASSYNNTVDVLIADNTIYNAGQSGGIIDDVGAYAVLVYNSNASYADPLRIMLRDNKIISPRTCGFYVAGATDVTISNNYVSGQTDPVTTTLPKGAIVTNAVDVATVVGNTLIDNQFGVSVVAASTGVTNATVISSNTIKSSRNWASPGGISGIVIAPMSGSTQDGYVEIIGNIVINTGTSARNIFIPCKSSEAIKSIKISNNDLYATYNCINVYTGDSSSPNIGSLDIVGNSLRTSGSGAIYMAYMTSTDIRIESNNFLGGWDGSSSYVFDIPNSHGMIIKDNAFYEFSTGTGKMFNTTNTRGVLSGNTFHNVSSSRLYVYSGGEVLGVDKPTWTADVGTFVQNIDLSDTSLLGWTRNSTQWADNILTFSGNGDPDGYITANVGDLYRKQDGYGDLYIKESGTGNTGWSEVITRRIYNGLSPLISGAYVNNQIVNGVLSSPGWTVISEFDLEELPDLLYLDSIMMVSGGWLTGNIRIYDKTNTVAVAGSTLTTTSTTGQKISSGNLLGNLIQGNRYQIQAEVIGGGDITDFGTVRYAILRGN